MKTPILKRLLQITILFFVVCVFTLASKLVLKEVKTVCQEQVYKTNASSIINLIN